MFDEGRYWDIFTEYCKNTPSDVLIKITIANRGPEEARVHVLPTLWFRNTWSWGCDHVGCDVTDECKRKPRLMKTNKPGEVECQHESLRRYIFMVDNDQDGLTPELVFTENETNLKVK